MTSARFMTVKQVHEELGISLAGAYRAIAEMKPARVGRLIRVARIDFEEYRRAASDLAHSPQAIRVLPADGARCAEEPARLDLLDGHVYVVEAVGTDRAKVGWTRCGVGNRLVTLQTASPFELVVRLEVTGSRELEFACHRALAAVRVSSTTEWFHGVAGAVLTVARMQACAIDRAPWVSFPCEARA